LKSAVQAANAARILVASVLITIAYVKFIEQISGVDVSGLSERRLRGGGPAHG
jgi:hypothetical protein